MNERCFSDFRDVQVMRSRLCDEGFGEVYVHPSLVASHVRTQTIDVLTFLKVPVIQV